MDDRILVISRQAKASDRPDVEFKKVSDRVYVATLDLEGKPRANKKRPEERECGAK